MEQSVFNVTLDYDELNLIELVKHYPELYDPLHESFNDKAKTTKIWREIARQLNKDALWCYVKWKDLSLYYKGRRKLYQFTKSSATKAKIREWPYFEAFNYLDDVYENMEEDVPNGADANSIVDELSILSKPTLSEDARNSGYMDETQYHSLDGIAERAEDGYYGKVKVVESSSGCQSPTRKKKKLLRLNLSEASSLKSRSKINESQDNNDTYLVTPSIVSVQSNAQTTTTIEPDKLNNQVSQDERTNIENSTLATVIPSSSSISISACDTSKRGQNTKRKLENEDCPHYHFCMSLLTRLRNMDGATALFTQMKIMEVLLQTEFPREYYNKRTNKN